MENELITYWAFIKWFAFDYKFSILLLVLYPYFYYTVSPGNYKKNKIKRDNETIGRIVFTVCRRALIIINFPFIFIFSIAFPISALLGDSDSGREISALAIVLKILTDSSFFHNSLSESFYSLGRSINHIDIAMYVFLYWQISWSTKKAKSGATKKTKRTEAKQKRSIEENRKGANINFKEQKYKNEKEKRRKEDEKRRKANIANKKLFEDIKERKRRERERKKLLQANKRKYERYQKKLLIDEVVTKFKFDKSHEVIKSFKRNIICLDMPMEMVTFLKGKKFNRKRTVSKKGNIERYNYQPYKSSRGNTKYKLEVDFKDGLVIKFQDL
jgi:hypothetical protein